MIFEEKPKLNLTKVKKKKYSWYKLNKVDIHTTINGKGKVSSLIKEKK